MAAVSRLDGRVVGRECADGPARSVPAVDRNNCRIQRTAAGCPARHAFRENELKTLMRPEWMKTYWVGVSEGGGGDGGRGGSYFML